MLVSLSIRDVVLVEQLDIHFDAGLGALTGETGAGKSILLDALGLAIGRRADSGLVRRGADQARVTALFEPPADHVAWRLITEQGLDAEDGVLLRRTLGADGRSRAFVNDQPVSVAFLRELGEALVEIHGQNDRLGLLDPATHRGVLDSYGGHEDILAETRAAHAAWRGAEAALAETEAAAEAARRDADYVRHVLAELDALAPEAGEEERLARERTRLMHGERVAEALAAAERELIGKGAMEARLRTAQREIERAAEVVGDRLTPLAETLERAAIETGEAIALLGRAMHDLELRPERLESVEARLFALRGAARKHDVAVDALPDLQKDFARRIAAIDETTAGLAVRRKAVEEAKARYRSAADTLSRRRREAAERLAAAVTGELAPLRMAEARFAVAFTPLSENEWAAEGVERVTFTVATNVGTNPGPLHRIASGGELSRFMLALKVVLAETMSAPTLIFDEVDAGIGGAVADAVGARLARLGGSNQVLVVTHQPQVAARASEHYLVAKKSNGTGPRTSVERLPPAARREEIARMLAGAEITEAARAAADSLLSGHP